VVLGQPLATVGDFPAAFAAVYVLGAIAAFGIGFHALKKAREVNAENFEDLSPDPQDSDNEVS
jgi:hypothetical protein